LGEVNLLSIKGGFGKVKIAKFKRRTEADK
jgi:hypothetical protein